MTTMMLQQLSQEKESSEKAHYPLYYKVSENAPMLLVEVLEEEGWSPYEKEESPYWNLTWKSGRYTLADYHGCQPWQKINHFPNTAIITKKDSLWRCLRTMQGIYGRIFQFLPQTFVLPMDYTKFVKVYAHEEEFGKKPTWICKPVGLSRGRGIFLFRELSDLTYDFHAVVQRYIENPMLINNHKFDIRCYVVVTSYDPLTIYIYKDAMIRFATQRYTTEILSNVYCHLTNTSINKFSPNSSMPQYKQTLQDLEHIFKGHNLNFEFMWKRCALDSSRIRVMDIIMLTFLPVSQRVPKCNGCFELYGFDILIDAELKPWLLEVNFSPALGVDCDVDISLKKPLLRDLIKLLGLQEGQLPIPQETSSKSNIGKLRKATTKKSNPTSHITVAPSSYGGWNKIFPFNDITHKASYGLKVGEKNMKLAINEIKKRQQQQSAVPKETMPRLPPIHQKYNV